MNRVGDRAFGPADIAGLAGVAVQLLCVGDDTGHSCRGDDRHRSAAEDAPQRDCSGSAEFALGRKLLLPGLTGGERMRRLPGQHKEPGIRTFWWVSGQLTEVKRFINVPMRWCEQYPTRERRELWVKTDQGEEFKLVVHTRVMPARRGHQVVAVLLGRRLVGLRNLTTGERVNFVRSDPPLLWRRCDGVVAVAAMVGGIAVVAMAGGRAPLLVALAAIFSAPSVVIARWVNRSRARREVESAMEESKRQASGQPALRRVK